VPRAAGQEEEKDQLRESGGERRRRETRRNGMLVRKEKKTVSPPDRHTPPPSPTPSALPGPPPILLGVHCVCGMGSRRCCFSFFFEALPWRANVESAARRKKNPPPRLTPLDRRAGLITIRRSGGPEARPRDSLLKIDPLFVFFFLLVGRPVSSPSFSAASSPRRLRLLQPAPLVGSRREWHQSTAKREGNTLVLLVLKESPK